MISVHLYFYTDNSEITEDEVYDHLSQDNHFDLFVKFLFPNLTTDYTVDTVLSERNDTIYLENLLKVKIRHNKLFQENIGTNSFFEDYITQQINLLPSIYDEAGTFATMNDGTNIKVQIRKIIYPL